MIIRGQVRKERGGGWYMYFRCYVSMYIHYINNAYIAITYFSYRSWLHVTSWFIENHLLTSFKVNGEENQDKTFNVYRCAIKVDFVGERDREKKRERNGRSIFYLFGNSNS